MAQPLLRPAALACLATLTLAGCSTSGPAQPAACPVPGIVAGLETTTVFRGGGATGREADLQYAVAMENIGGGCTYDSAGMRIQLSVDIVVEPGPAFAGPAATVPWFVAIADPAGSIVDKQVFSSTVNLSPGTTRGGVREAIEQRYAGVDRNLGGGYRIYLGLEIDRDEALRRRATLP